jgi:hypothetical protein
MGPRHWRLWALCLLLLRWVCPTAQQSSPPVFAGVTPSIGSAGSSGVSIVVSLTSPGRVSYVVVPAAAPTPLLSAVLDPYASVAGLVARCVCF